MFLIAEEIREGNRFYDLAEKCNGLWKLLRRQMVYDMGMFTLPRGLVEIDQAVVAHYPRKYAPLAYVLEKSSFPIQRLFATRGSELRRIMKAEGRAWLPT